MNWHDGSRPMKIENLEQRGMLFVRIRRALLIGAAAALGLWAPAAGAQPTVRLMPLGDSLTSSVDGQASYRYWLWRGLQNYHFQVDFIGSLWGVGSSAAPYDFDQNHEGHAGATTDDIAGDIAGWASAARPDVVLLIIGANDLEQGYSPAHAIQNIRSIIVTLRQINPNVAILWAMLPPIPGVKNVGAFNNAVVANAVRWSLRTSPVRVVNLWSGFNPAQWTLDGQHPNIYGEKFYANRFYTQLTPILGRYGQRARR